MSKTPIKLWVIDDGLDERAAAAERAYFRLEDPRMTDRQYADLRAFLASRARALAALLPLWVKVLEARTRAAGARADWVADRGDQLLRDQLATTRKRVVSVSSKYYRAKRRVHKMRPPWEVAHAKWPGHPDDA